MKAKARHLSLSEREAYRRLEDVVGCKWSAAVVGALQRGVTRPGKLERYIPGISTKVLTERLRKLAEFGLIVREDRSESAVLHVEYRLTSVGEKLAAILEQLHALQAEHERSQATGNRETAAKGATR
jgi:DNA-binding HxlR family transcriptional regulator